MDQFELIWLCDVPRVYELLLRHPFQHFFAIAIQSLLTKNQSSSQVQKNLSLYKLIVIMMFTNGTLMVYCWVFCCALGYIYTYAIHHMPMPPKLGVSALRCECIYKPHSRTRCAICCPLYVPSRIRS